MEESDEVETFEMPARYDPPELCQVGRRVRIRKVDGRFPAHGLSLDAAGDYEIVRRDRHPALGGWLRFTLRKIG